MNSRMTALIALIGLSAIPACPAYAEVPTAADFAACNVKAAEQAAADSASASPRTDQRAPKRAPETIAGQAGAPRGDVEMPAPPAGKAGAAAVTRDPTGKTLSSDKDPQINGMAADRANDPVYVATYRSCMRQRGF